MSLADSLSSGTNMGLKNEDLDFDEGLQDIDMDKPASEGVAPQGEEDEDDAELPADEEMEDLFGDDKDVDEVKHEGSVPLGLLDAKTLIKVVMSLVRPRRPRQNMSTASLRRKENIGLRWNTRKKTSLTP